MGLWKSSAEESVPDIADICLMVVEEFWRLIILC